MPDLSPTVNEQDHARGPEDAPVTLVEYGDFECPHCGEAYPIVQKVLRDMDGEIRFVFRNFPLSQSHPHAERAAEAAEAAGAQGKFWKMHNLLFQHQNALSERDLHQYAEEIGLDMQRFEREMARKSHADQVQEDFLSGVRSGVNGTPTFFINGRRYDGPIGASSLEEALEQAASKA